jgi:hypothetical protein
MFAWLHEIFRKKTAAEYRSDGEKAAREFLAENPSDSDIRQYWSSAHVDRDMTLSTGRSYYARGVIDVLKPVWRSSQSRFE